LRPATPAQARSAAPDPHQLANSTHFHTRPFTRKDRLFVLSARRCELRGSPRPSRPQVGTHNHSLLRNGVGATDRCCRISLRPERRKARVGDHARDAQNRPHKIPTWGNSRSAKKCVSH
jgi:hypothetical protein